MTNDEIQERLDKLTTKKKKLDNSRTLATFVFCILLFDWQRFLEGAPSLLLKIIMGVITIAPLGIIIYESKLIKDLKDEIKSLNTKLQLEQANESAEEENKELNEDADDVEDDDSAEVKTADDADER